jgi:hypothetical protein
VTLIDDSTVAVSTSGDVRIINIDTKCTERVIKTTSRCYGITYPLGQITHPLLLCAISFGILIFEYKVNLISLIECKVGGSTTDIICACLESLSENGSLKQLNIKCSIDYKILDLMSTIATFGSVAIETGSQRAVIKTEKNKQAQIMSVVEPPTYS